MSETDQSALVFVYGTLKPGGRFHNTYCAPFSCTAIKAWTSGRLFDFPEHGYPGAIEDPTSRIYGYVLHFPHSGKLVLSNLDQLEGYDPDGIAEENEYYRKWVSVQPMHGEKQEMQAWCYFMSQASIELNGGVAIPDGDWKTSASNIQ